MTAWTPGPWSRDGPFGTRVKGGGREICDTVADSAEGDAEAAANARLIAAAPELYDALLAFNSAFGEKCPCPMHTKARAALAKALGEKS